MERYFHIVVIIKIISYWRNNGNVICEMFVFLQLFDKSLSALSKNIFIEAAKKFFFGIAMWRG